VTVLFGVLAAQLEEPGGVPEIGVTPGSRHRFATVSLAFLNEQFAGWPRLVQAPGNDRRTADVTLTVDRRRGIPWRRSMRMRSRIPGERKASLAQ
jgi:hypothetical protein